MDTLFLSLVTGRLGRVAVSCSGSGSGSTTDTVMRTQKDCTERARAVTALVGHNTQRG